MLCRRKVLEIRPWDTTPWDMTSKKSRVKKNGEIVDFFQLLENRSTYFVWIQSRHWPEDERILRVYDWQTSETCAETHPLHFARITPHAFLEHDWSGWNQWKPLISRFVQRSRSKMRWYWMIIIYNYRYPGVKRKRPRYGLVRLIMVYYWVINQKWTHLCKSP